MRKTPPKPPRYEPPKWPMPIPQRVQDLPLDIRDVIEIYNNLRWEATTPYELSTMATKEVGTEEDEAAIVGLVTNLPRTDAKDLSAAIDLAIRAHVQPALQYELLEAVATGLPASSYVLEDGVPLNREHRIIQRAIRLAQPEIRRLLQVAAAQRRLAVTAFTKLVLQRYGTPVAK